MPSTNAGGSGQAPAGPADSAANGQAPTPALTNNGSAPQGGAQNGQAPTAIDDTLPTPHEWKRFQQELAEARRDAAKAANERKALQDASLTAEQKRERDFSELQTNHLEATLENQRLHLQLAGYRLGSTLGIADIGAALALVQVEHAHAIDFDAKSNEPKNLEELLKAVLKDHPGLATQAQNQQQQQSPMQPGQYQRPPVQSGPPMSPGMSAAPVTQPANRPLRTFNDVQWKV